MYDTHTFRIMFSLHDTPHPHIQNSSLVMVGLAVQHVCEPRIPGLTCERSTLIYRGAAEGLGKPPPNLNLEAIGLKEAGFEKASPS